eukprot:TRINITY_DN814_c0_g1_i3.p2 TRINITY_DN814_c0_g1~~TRINITY_DN814_c0_g1_i3.p2  ORF type:complete len:150 (+),score=10.30 TRINITY_DN814_c0_g1_i3:87-536(+)
MIRRPPRSTLSSSSAASDVYKRQMLYSGGFFSPTDRKLMDQVRMASPSELAEIDLPFQDARLEEMLLRYKARNCPAVLTHEEQMQWEGYRRDKLIKGENGHLTMERFYQRLNELYSEHDQDENKKHILEELSVYAEAIYPLEEAFDEAY